MKIHGIVVLLLILSFSGYGQAGLEACFAVHKGDSLVLENTVMQRAYLFNGGNIIACSVTDKRTGKKWVMNSRRPAFSILGLDAEASHAQFNVKEVTATRQAGAHLEAELIDLGHDCILAREPGFPAGRPAHHEIEKESTPLHMFSAPFSSLLHNTYIGKRRRISKRAESGDWW